MWLVGCSAAVAAMATNAAGSANATDTEESKTTDARTRSKAKPAWDK
jgi:hypothetical protein